MNGIKVLIADDSAVMRKIVERSLRSAGLELSEVFNAGSGLEALDILRSNKVNLILTDINMSQMSGLQFLRQLSAEDLAPGTPIVMITAEGSEEYVKQAVQAGARGYILKPFTPEQFKERILPLLETMA
jgi:two-component system chemotaxis response regulator CheY